MKNSGKMDAKRLYLGVDVGGTKVQASLVAENGEVLNRERASTPRDVGPDQVLGAIEQVIDAVLAKSKSNGGRLKAMGVAIPGVVDPRSGRIVVTPNMNLTGVAVGTHLKHRFKVPVAIGNDCNLGALGETWLGSAHNAASAVAMLVGTGIGGGFVRKGKLWRGARESAAEVGHMIMQIGGPLCGCGNRGCLEALASRTAIERDIRAAVESGRPSVIGELCGGDLSVIRSGALRKAIEAKDGLVVEVLQRAAEILGYACLTVRHLIDPEVILLGGGVIEACGEFMLPIVENIVASDKLPGAREGGHVLVCALGDDAVSLGAVALARMKVGRSPFKKRFADQLAYPTITHTACGEVTVDRKSYSRDIFISVFGEVKTRKKAADGRCHEQAHSVDVQEVEKICKGGPDLLIVAAGREGRLSLTDPALRFLAQRSIRVEVLPTPQAVEFYNQASQRKAMLIHVSC
jgi:glucokinase